MPDKDSAKEVLKQFKTAVKELKPFIQRGDRKKIVALLAKDGHEYSIESINKAVNGQTANLTIAMYVLKFLKARKKDFVSVTKQAADLKAELGNM